MPTKHRLNFWMHSDQCCTSKLNLDGDTIDPDARLIPKYLHHARDKCLQFLDPSPMRNHHDDSQRQAFEVLLVGYPLIRGDQRVEVVLRGKFEQDTVLGSSPSHLNDRVDLKRIREVSRQSSRYRLVKQQLHRLTS